MTEYCDWLPIESGVSFPDPNSLAIIEFDDESLSPIYEEMISRAGKIYHTMSDPTLYDDNEDSDEVVDEPDIISTDEPVSDPSDTSIQNTDVNADDIVGTDEPVTPTFTPEVATERLGPIFTGACQIPEGLSVKPRLFLGLKIGNAGIRSSSVKYVDTPVNNLVDGSNRFSEFTGWEDPDNAGELGAVLEGDAKAYYIAKYPTYRSVWITSFVSEKIKPLCGLRAVFSTLAKGSCNIASLDGCIGLVTPINSSVMTTYYDYTWTNLRDDKNYYRYYLPRTYGAGLSRWDVSQVKDFYRAFRKCRLWFAYNPDTDKIENPWSFIDKWDFLSAVDISSMFAKSNIRGIDLTTKSFPNLVRAAGLLTDTVDNETDDPLYNTFSFKLAPLVSKEKTPNLQYIGSMFSGVRLDQSYMLDDPTKDDKFNSNILREWDVSNIKNMPYIFDFKYTGTPVTKVIEITESNETESPDPESPDTPNPSALSDSPDESPSSDEPTEGKDPSQSVDDTTSGGSSGTQSQVETSKDGTATLGKVESPHKPSNPGGISGDIDEPLPSTYHFIKTNTMEFQLKLLDIIKDWDISNLEVANNMFNNWNNPLLDLSLLDKWSELPGFDPTKLKDIFKGVAIPMAKEYYPSWYDPTIHGSRLVDDPIDPESVHKMTIGWSTKGTTGTKGTSFTAMILGYLFPGAAITEGNSVDPLSTVSRYNSTIWRNANSSRRRSFIEDMLGVSIRDMELSVEEDTNRLHELYSDIVTTGSRDENYETLCRIGIILNRNYYDVLNYNGLAQQLDRSYNAGEITKSKALNKMKVIFKRCGAKGKIVLTW